MCVCGFLKKKKKKKQLILLVFEFCGVEIFELLDDSSIKSELEEDIFNDCFPSPQQDNKILATKTFCGIANLILVVCLFVCLENVIA